MKFEYNGNLEFEERIAIISKEIISFYPEISKKDAMMIAALEPPITKINDLRAKFRRFYDILYFYQNNKLFQNKVFKNMQKMYKKNKVNDKKIDYLMESLTDYFQNNEEFPKFE